METQQTAAVSRVSMIEPSYRFRRNLFERERTYTLTEQGLGWSDARGSDQIEYSKICEISVYSVIGSSDVPASWRCSICPVAGKKIGLSSLSFSGLGNYEDRTAAMVAFSRALIARSMQSNPSIIFTKGLPRGFWLMALFYLAAIAGCGLFCLVIAALMMSKPGASLGVVALLLAGAAGAVLMALLIWRWLRRSWPQRFDPLKVDPFDI